MKKYLFCIAIIFSVNSHLFSQKLPKDSIISGFFIEANVSGHAPSGDLADRFGLSATGGFGLIYKTNKNFIFGVEYNLMHGSEVKIENQLFKNIQTKEGFIIDGNGMFAEVFTFQRGFHTNAKVGKIFPWFGPNENSGPFINIGVGMLQHRIRIVNVENTAPQLTEEFTKGYDRLSSGISLHQQIGYFNIGNRRSFSFAASFEAIQAFTRPRRIYQYDLMGPEDNKLRLDLLFGVRLTWMVPINRRQSDGYYYF